jgi:FAD/FMN-containing dehydrogenase
VATPEGRPLKLLSRAKEETGGAVEAFELMGRLGVEFALRNIAGTRDPLAEPHPWYVLAEFASGEPGSAEAAMERFLAAGLEAGLVEDAVVAQTRNPGQGAVGHPREPVAGPEALRAPPGSTTWPCRSAACRNSSPKRPPPCRPSRPARVSPRSAT